MFSVALVLVLYGSLFLSIMVSRGVLCCILSSAYLVIDSIYILYLYYYVSNDIFTGGFDNNATHTSSAFFVYCLLSCSIYIMYWQIFVGSMILSSALKSNKSFLPKIATSIDILVCPLSICMYVLHPPWWLHLMGSHIFIFNISIQTSGPKI